MSISQWSSYDGIDEETLTAMKKLKVVFGLVLVSSWASNVYAQNSLPIADAGVDQVKMDLDLDEVEIFTLDAGGSADSDGTIVSYEWSDLDGNVLGTGVSIELQVSSPGQKVKLTIVDDGGDADTDYVDLLVGEPTNYGNNRIVIRGGKQEVFVNGINLAWDDYSKDIIQYNDEFFASVFEKLENYGANGLRWWLHTNGRFSPEFDESGLVKKINPRDIRNMRNALDKAYEHGIIISMCLFSFDLLQNQGQDQDLMKSLLEDELVMQSYIDNALIPIIAALGDHSAVMCWEVFNEPEGMTQEFGWTPVKTNMLAVQTFVNKIAGAIHRNTEKALVSNGSWSVKASSDINNFKNYYTDELLVQAGGDEEGYLDFYQIHYYPDHFGNDYSPFHRPASHWDLDKPVVIGEFPASGVDSNKVDAPVTITNCYKKAMEYGYAGVMAWNYTGFQGADIENTREGMEYLFDNFSQDIVIGNDDSFTKPPSVIAEIKDLRAYSGDNLDFVDYTDLGEAFSDPEGEALSYSVYDFSNADFAEFSFDGSKLSVHPYDGVEGTETVTIQASDPEGASEWISFNVSLRPFTGNIAMFKDIEASTSEVQAGITKKAELANDGDISTRWSSEYADDQWLIIDLQETQFVNEVKLYWEDAFASAYKIETSHDQIEWTTVYTESNGDGEWDDVSFERHETRYLRISCTTRATDWGFSLWEVEAYDNFVLTAEKFSSSTLYPNPTFGSVNIQSETTILKADILNVNGQQMLSTTGTDLRSVDLSALSSGVYAIRLYSKNSVKTFRIVKQ